MINSNNENSPAEASFRDKEICENFLSRKCLNISLDKRLHTEVKGFKPAVSYKNQGGSIRLVGLSQQSGACRTFDETL